MSYVPGLKNSEMDIDGYISKSFPLTAVVGKIPRVMKTLPGYFLAAAIGALGCLTSLPAGAVSLASPANGLALQLDAGHGSYQLSVNAAAWSFGGSLNAPLKKIAVRRGHDTTGAFQQITFAWQAGQLPMHGEIRLYQENPVVLFAQTCDVAAEGPPAAFPDFTALPPKLRVFSYGKQTFAPCRREFKRRKLCAFKRRNF